MKKKKKTKQKKALRILLKNMFWVTIIYPQIKVKQYLLKINYLP